MISEERLRQAAQEASRALADSLPEPEDCPDLVPSGFEQRLNQRLTKKAPRRKWSTLKRVACFLVVMVLSGTVFLSTNAQARESFLGWFSQIGDGVSHYTYDGPELVKPTGTDYSLGEIPEGYWPCEDGVYQNDGVTEILYENDAGLLLAFGYLERATENSTADFFIDIGDTPKTDVLVNGEPADCYWDQTNQTGSTIVWRDEERGMLLYISGFFSQDELVTMAEQVVRDTK